MLSVNGRIAGFRRILFDALVLAICLYLYSSWFTADFTGWKQLLSATAFYFIVASDLGVAFILGFSTNVFTHQRMNMLTMAALRFFTDISIIQFFNYVLGKERSGVFSPSVLPLALATTCLFAVIWRLLLFESLYFNKNYKFFCTPDTTDKIKKELHSFPGTFEYYSEREVYEKVQLSTSIFVVEGEHLSEKDLQFLMNKRMHGVKVFTVNQFYEQVLRKIPIELLTLNDLIFDAGFELTSRMFLQRLKRVSDIMLSSVLFLLTWPLVLIFGLIHKLESRGPMLYSQMRTGYKGEEFKIYKLRSMRTDAEAGGAVWAQKDDPRITRVGKFLRLTRIDELPQLWNVLKGDMSFIGPRPERPEFNVSLAEQIPFYDMRHMIRPGLTGWAQVRYPYGASVEDAKEKLQFDLYYIKNYSLLLDLEILLKTVQVVIFGKGR